jgi:hypothetical protein
MRHWIPFFCNFTDSPNPPGGSPVETTKQEHYKVPHVSWKCTTVVGLDHRTQWPGPLCSCVWIHTYDHTPSMSTHTVLRDNAQKKVLRDNAQKTLSSTPSCNTWSPVDWKHSEVPNDLTKVVTFSELHSRVIASVLHLLLSSVLFFPPRNAHGRGKKKRWGVKSGKINFAFPIGVLTAQGWGGGWNFRYFAVLIPCHLCLMGRYLINSGGCVPQ